MIRLNVKVPSLTMRLTKKGRAMIEAAREGLRQVASAAFEEWQSIAARRLKSTRRIYQDSLHLKLGSGKAPSEITLFSKDPSHNWLVQGMEYGVGAFDMKPSRLSRKKGPGGITPRPAFHWSEFHKTKSGQKKKNPPFVDIPFGGGRRTGSTPKSYRRVSPKSGGFQHPGFKPVGTGGPGPMRHEVIEYIRKQVPIIIGPIIKKMGGSI